MKTKRSIMKSFSRVMFLFISLLLIFSCSRPVPAGPQSVTVNGIKINYVEQGSGDERIVFVHGYAGFLENWKHVLELLPKEYHAYALDLRGSGGSEKPGSYKLNEMIEDIHAFSQKLGIKRFTWVGHSLGGKIGYKFALDHTDMLKAMFLIAPAPAHDFIPEAQRDAFINQITSVFGSADILRGFITKDFATPPNEEDINEFITKVMAVDPVAKKETAGWWVSTNLESQLGNINIPTFILVGAKDRLPIDWQKRYVKAIKECRFEVLQDVGHMVPYECPQKVVDLLTDFIQEVNKK